MSTIQKDQLAKIVFTVVGLLDSCEETLLQDDNKRIEFAKLNLMAGKKAMAYSAFKSATSYLGKAIKLLLVDSWIRHQDLCIDIFSSAAESEYCVANFDQMRSYVDQVKNNPSVPPKSKFRVYHVLIEALVAEKNVKGSIAVGIECVSYFGVKFPRTKMVAGCSTVIGLMYTKFSKRRKDPEALNALKISEDPVDTGVMKTLDKLATCAFLGDADLFPLVVLKSLDWTFAHGITIHSPAAFALAGLMLTNFLDDPAGGWSYGEHALAILNRIKSKEPRSRTMFLVYNYIAHWTKPMQECAKPLLNGYKIGLVTGDVQSAMYQAYFYNEVMMYTGLNLDVVDENMSMYASQMKELGQFHTLQAFSFVCQAVRNLRGQGTTSTTTLTSDLMDQKAVLEEVQKAGDILMETTLHRYRLLLACYFGDYELGAKISMKWGNRAVKLLPGQPINIYVRFAGSLCSLIVAQRSGDKKFMKEGKRLHRIVKRWSENPKAPNPNCFPHEALLSAELAAISGKAANKMYEAAVLLAGRRGLLGDQALANERYSEYLRTQGNEEDSDYRFREALRLYREWGAIRKVDMMMKSSSD